MANNKPHKSAQIICKSKKRFGSEELVIDFIDVSEKSGILDYYFCNNCQGFHTSTMEGKNKIFNKRKTLKEPRVIRRMRF
jgi:hypothetical protein